MFIRPVSTRNSSSRRSRCVRLILSLDSMLRKT
jgi:hypothetical protein